jgi:ATP-dependent DNA helicase DinG
MYRFFGPSGFLSQWHPQFEHRPDQLRMAKAVEAAIRERRHLLVEAGTGTGKTLAYLVPALLSGKRVVISTGTKNLQEQLFYKDLPLLRESWPQPLRVSVMKGRNNYLCRSKLHGASELAILDGLEEVREFEQIQQWESTTQTGDRAEVRGLAEDSRVWPKLDARADRCTGQRCSHFEGCFLTNMHRLARESDVIIVNHHLLFADLAVKDTDFGAIIPDYSVLVLDEAHEVEDVAGQYFGLSVSNLQVQELARDTRMLLRMLRRKDPQTDQALHLLDDASGAFFQKFSGPDGRVGGTVLPSLREGAAAAYADLLLALSLVGSGLQTRADGVADFAPLFRRAQTLHETLRTWMEDPGADQVHWVERRGRGVTLQSCPVDVSALLREKLFGAVETVIMTSATLAVGDSFDFIQNRLGVDAPVTLRVDGHFDYPRQAILYTPTGLPDPRSPQYAEVAMELLEELLAYTQGRAFLLFTSHQQMRAFHAGLRQRLPYPTLLQGSAPKHQLLTEFKETPHAVLFATSAFWQGVDVPGDQLSCVVVDKLPFAAPNDPVVSARVQRINSGGGDAFREYQVPQAAIALKQGFGRLIRSSKDRGVLAILDRRIRTMSYGRTFLESLPPYSQTTHLQDVAEFLRG